MCFSSSCVGCFVFDYIHITCLVRRTGAFFFDQCFDCLLCFVFEYRLHSFTVFQTLWTYQLEQIIIIIIISDYYYRFQVSVLPLGHILLQHLIPPSPLETG